MQHIEIIIVGGGLAGLIAAHQLAKKGKEVLLIEKKTYPFHRVCGEYISNEVRPFLLREGLFPEYLDHAQISKFELSSVYGKSAEIPLDLGGFGISRYALDEFLYQKAKNEGAQFLLQTQVDDLKFLQKEDRFELLTNSGQKLSCKHLIGAFGKRSKVDKLLQRDFIHQRSPYIGVKYHIQTDAVDPQTVALHNFEGGYCGVNRVENNTFNLCYLGSKAQLKKYGNIPDMEEAVLHQNPKLRDIFHNSTFLFEKPEVINEISFSPKKPVENHLLMAGDAAGLIAPLCGNGMAIAIQTGKMAAEAILSSHDRSTIEKTYASEWNKIFKQRLWIGRTVQRLFGSDHLSKLAVGMVVHSPALATAIMKRTHGQAF